MVDYMFNNSPIIGLLFFMSVFAIVLVMVFLPNQSDKYKSYAEIPLNDVDDKYEK